MIRFINCMKRRADITPEQFREYWADPRFTALLDRVANMTGATLYTRNLTLIVEANELVRELRGSSEPPDGVLEFWWDDTARLSQITGSPAGQSLNEEMLAFQRQFVDLEASTAFFVEG